jgi:hypothetical protein
MEASAIAALQYCKNIKKIKLDEHRRLNLAEGPCSGLTYREWKLPVRQKSTFAKGKRFASTRLWNYKSVPTEQGFKSLIIKTK